jgi:hypothetical protein
VCPSDSWTPVCASSESNDRDSRGALPYSNVYHCAHTRATPCIPCIPCMGARIDMRDDAYTAPRYLVVSCIRACTMHVTYHATVTYAPTHPIIMRYAYNTRHARAHGSCIRSAQPRIPIEYTPMPGLLPIAYTYLRRVYTYMRVHMHTYACYVINVLTYGSNTINVLDICKRARVSLRKS